MADLQDDFRATAENIAHDAKALERIEAETSTLEPSGSRAMALFERAEELAAQLHHKSLPERDLIETAAER